MTTTVPAADLSDRVSEEIRAMMARRRMSGRELARRLGVSPAWVSYRLTNSQPIDLNDFQRIATALEVGVEDLLPRRDGLLPGSRGRQPVNPLAPRIIATVGEAREHREHRKPVKSVPVHSPLRAQRSPSSRPTAPVRPRTPALV